jgi:hypothetical protein
MWYSRNTSQNLDTFSTPSFLEENKPIIQVYYCFLALGCAFL